MRIGDMVVAKIKDVNRKAVEMFGEDIKNKGSAVSLEPGEEFSVVKV
ncbi:MAG: hypothetical protein UU80_C0037G0002 [candidate division WWE3 bacterium GW2011_GWA1_41_8]|uniref:Uncharacterized protein n=1 Tax=candidate division WWE3 bacterium GW2011_GWA1_41_8 TaxID=1619103 RepID=A0A0G1A6J7_UNCKA|nr:MAG: hypothetical protein UU80_C0037G0002 [candidate division WWE3 bacterium GW2011_GWA1_41_8]